MDIWRELELIGEIDLVLCMGRVEGISLTTSGIYIQEKIGAKNAWAIDLQQRCCTTVAAMKIAKDMMIADEDINTVMVVGGYRNGDFVDYTDKAMSMMYNLGAGGGALILRKNYGKNLLLGTHIMTDGSLARTAGVKYGGTEHPITAKNLDQAYKSLNLRCGFRKTVSMKFQCRTGSIVLSKLLQNQT